MAVEKTDIGRCPSCGGRDIRRSHSRKLLDALLGAFHRYPMRCRQCRDRFYLHVVNEDEEEGGEAKGG